MLVIRRGRYVVLPCGRLGATQTPSCIFISASQQLGPQPIAEPSRDVECRDIGWHDPHDRGDERIDPRGNNVLTISWQAIANSRTAACRLNGSARSPFAPRETTPSAILAALTTTKIASGRIIDFTLQAINLTQSVRIAHGMMNSPWLRNENQPQKSTSLVAS
jgi:hypothetical protein